MSQFEFEALSGGIKKSGGKVILLVSPDDPVVGKRFAAVYEKTLKQTKTPVIVLESEKHVNSLREELANMGVHSPVILPTGGQNPFLALRGKPAVHDATQKDLADLLRGLGVTNVLLGGTHSLSFGSEIGHVDSDYAKDLARVLEAEKKLHETLGIHTPNKMDLITHGCVGTTYRNLLACGMKVRLYSPLVWPYKPEYWRRMIALPHQMHEKAESILTKERRNPARK